MTAPRNGASDGTDGGDLQVAAHLGTSRHQPLLAAGSTTGLVQLYDLRQASHSHLVASLKLHQKPLVRPDLFLMLSHEKHLHLDASSAAKQLSRFTGDCCLTCGMHPGEERDVGQKMLQHKHTSINFVVTAW